ncbi:MAG: HAD-IC family P-type ATPase [Thermoleophilia bacterium]
MTRRRRAAGSRSYAEIVWENTFTLFNLVLGALLVLTLTLGDPKDALFGGVIIANSLIGIVQEIRAKRVLDRLSLLVAPKARRLLPDGGVEEVPAEAVAVGDRVRVEAGDQVVADGVVDVSHGLSLDESMLTGESDPVARPPGERILSGAFCVAGSGEFTVDAVGAESFAERLAEEARGTRASLSPLQEDVNTILKLTVAVMIPLAIALTVSLLIRDVDTSELAATVVAALVPLVPEGLVLLTSLTFAVAAVRLARLGTLAQRLNAIESLASVDTLCLDKTGTLTDNRLTVDSLETAPGVDDGDLRAALAALVGGSASANATLTAIGEAVPGSEPQVRAEVPFSSARKWSGVTVEGLGTVVLGAPDVLARDGVPLGDALGARVADEAGAGRRVVLVTRGDTTLEGETLPDGLAPLGIVILAESMRPEAADTVGFLTREGVRSRVISGDSPVTVRAVAMAAGVPGADGPAVSGADLPEDPEALGDVTETTAVYGRITPEQKRSLVRAMTARGRYVAMTGDGVNDVLALKEARLGIAMGQGSQIAKGVAGLVLLTNSFATVPRAVREGRRIIRNTHRVAKLFVAKSVYSAVVLATLGMAPIAYPFLARQVTITSTLTIGIPAFFLALAPSEGPVRREGFMRSLVAFVVPAGVISAAAIIAAYLITRGPLDEVVAQGRTAATLVATGMGLAIVVEVERGLEKRKVRWWVWAMVAAFAAALTIGLQIPWLRDFFALEEPTADVWWTVAAVLVVGIVVMSSVRRIPWLARREEGATA